MVRSTMITFCPEPSSIVLYPPAGQRHRMREILANVEKPQPQSRVRLDFSNEFVAVGESNASGYPCCCPGQGICISAGLKGTPSTPRRGPCEDSSGKPAQRSGGPSPRSGSFLDRHCICPGRPGKEVPRRIPRIGPTDRADGRWLVFKPEIFERSM